MPKNIARRMGRGQLAPVGQLWPNGEFGLSWRPSGRSEEVDKVYEYTCGIQAKTGQPLPTEPIDVLGGDGGLSPIDLVNVSNSHTIEAGIDGSPNGRSPRGGSGLTMYGKRMVRNCAEALEVFYGPSRLTFLTLTLPDMPHDQRMEANRQWAEMIRQFLQWLSRHLSTLGLPSQTAGVTEIQPQRCAKTGHRWLHYHAVFVGRQMKGAWGITPKEVRKAWTDIVRGQVTGFEGECTGENLKGVKGDCGGYLSKYMSKGSNMEGTGELPSAWWNASLRLRREVKKRVRTSDGAAEWLQMLIDDHIEDPGEAFYWLRPVILWGDDGTGFLIGWTGKIKPNAFP